MLFFQMVLLLGYLYAHWLHEKLGGRLQAIVHIGALALSCAALPILPNPSWKSAGGAPSLKILALLAATVGLPYFLLASTSPLLQAWYARTHGAARTLVHGTINHGEQFLREKYRRRPVTYFCPESGVGRAMGAIAGPGRSLGVIGLGCGTLAPYGQPGDTLSVYEINPLALDIARTHFTYLRDTPAKVEVAMGDARLSLEAEPSRQFDILVVDAFSSDAAPVHLLTLEAFRIYFRHLKPDGILAVNVTNRYPDLKPVTERAASALGKVALYYDFEADPNEVFCFSCDWMLIMNPDTLKTHAELKYGGEIMKPRPAFRAWTGDFSNLYSILRGGSLVAPAVSPPVLFQVRFRKPPHPGDVLRQLCLEPLNVNVTDAARSLGVSRKALSSIVNGRAKLSAA